MTYTTYQVQRILDNGTMTLPAMVKAEMLGAGRAIEILQDQPYSIGLKQQHAEKIINTAFGG